MVIVLTMLVGMLGCVPASPPPSDAPLGRMMPVDWPVDWLTDAPPTFVDTAAPTKTAAILAIHGLKGSAGVFARPARRWAERGFETFAVSVGYPAIAPQEILAALRGVMAAAPGRPVFVVGESLGASLAVTALALPDAPSPAGLILSGPAIWPSGPSAGLALWGLGWMNAIGADDALFWADIIRLMDAAREDARSVRAFPVLVLMGGRDEVVPRQGVTELMAGLGARARLWHFPDGGHTLMRDPGGDAIADQVADWMLAMASSRAEVTAGSAARPKPSDADQATAN